MKTKHTFLLHVEDPKKLGTSRVAELVNKLIDIGLADARDTADDKDIGDSGFKQDAVDVLTLDIKEL